MRPERRSTSGSIAFLNLSWVMITQPPSAAKA